METIRQKDAPSKTYWICKSGEKTKCKVNLITFENIVSIKSIGHNHQPTYYGGLGELKNQIVNFSFYKELGTTE